jgi:hypothetical protein
MSKWNTQICLPDFQNLPFPSWPSCKLSLWVRVSLIDKISHITHTICTICNDPSRTYAIRKDYQDKFTKAGQGNVAEQKGEGEIVIFLPCIFVKPRSRHITCPL